MGRTVDEIGDMPISELVRWTAFERVYGPILIHDRVDLGLAKLSYYMVKLLSEKPKRVQYEKFLPTYLQDLIKQSAQSPEALRTFFEGLASADNQHADG